MFKLLIITTQGCIADAHSLPEITEKMRCNIIGLYEKALPDELSYGVFYETSDEGPLLLSPLPENW